MSPFASRQRRVSKLRPNTHNHGCSSPQARTITNPFVIHLRHGDWHQAKGKTPQGRIPFERALSPATPFTFVPGFPDWRSSAIESTSTRIDESPFPQITTFGTSGQSLFLLTASVSCGTGTCIEAMEFFGHQSSQGHASSAGAPALYAPAPSYRVAIPRPD